MKVFVSYSSADEKEARAVAKCLKESGHDYWISCEHLNEDHMLAIPRVIAASDVVLLLVSENSKVSPGQETEVKLAEAPKARKAVIPFLLENVDPGDTWLYWPLQGYQTVKGYEKGGFEKLVMRLSCIGNELKSSEVIGRTGGGVKCDEVFSRAFCLGLKIFGKIATVVNNKGDGREGDEEIQGLMHELGLKCIGDVLDGYESLERDVFVKILNNQGWADPNYIDKGIREVHGDLCASVFAFGFRFLPWAVKDEMRNDENERQKMLKIMRDAALPEHFMQWVLSLAEGNVVQCRDALIQYFKHHKEHVYECPVCHVRVADDYRECPLCKSKLTPKC